MTSAGAGAADEGEDALVRAIHEHPDDPAPYLVYADHLLGRGDARGELIHVQLRLESLPAGAPDRKPLARRARELRRGLRPAWLVRAATCLWRFRRGFLDLLVVPWTTLRAHAAAAADPGADLVHVRHLALRRDVTRGRELPAADLAAILAIPALRRLEHLEVTSCTLDPAACRAIARADLPRLRSLDLDHASLPDAAVAALVEAAPELPSLEALSLPRNDLSAAAARSLADSPHLARLRSLGLSVVHGPDPSHTIGDRGAIALASSRNAGLLSHLDLRGQGITNETAGALAASSHLSSLTELRLARSDLDDRGAATLASSPSLARLRLLDLARTRLTDAGVAAIVQLPQLSTLYLNGVHLTADGIRALVEAPPHLTEVRACFLREGPTALHAAFLRRYGPPSTST